jgi:hypothetical protein
VRLPGGWLWDKDSDRESLLLATSGIIHLANHIRSGSPCKFQQTPFRRYRAQCIEDSPAEMTALLSTLQLTEPFLHSIIKDDVEGFDV